MDLLRIATAGSIDDGKSTLIGRLLYDTGSVPADRLEAARAAGRHRGAGELDLSLLTDGLIAERQQGITIDVAHVFFETARRKYIVADTPGHLEYTRNMITGASTAAASIVLVDVRAGFVEQTHRHCFIAALLRIPSLTVAVNKMDLAGWDRAAFDAVAADVARVTQVARPGLPEPRIVPVSALNGDNVVRRSAHSPWYEGPTLLEILESADPRPDRASQARLQVQTVLRAPDGERAYAGRIASGTFRVGDQIVALPGERRTSITRIERLGSARDTAQAGESVSVRVSDMIDISRGSVLAHSQDAPTPRTELAARLCWLDQTALHLGKSYVLQHGARVVRARIASLDGVLDIVTQRWRPAPGLSMNDIGRVVIQTSAAVFLDAFAANPSNGSFILIDEQSHRTVAGGFIDQDTDTASVTEGAYFARAAQ
jgi:sulfate adenylyltransferase subunit 1